MNYQDAHYTLPGSKSSLIQVATTKLPPGAVGEDKGESSIGGMKRALPHSSRHTSVQLSQAHVNRYAHEDGDAMFQPRHRLEKNQVGQVAEGSKEVRDAALTNLVVWPCLAHASDATMKDKWPLNFKVLCYVLYC